MSAPVLRRFDAPPWKVWVALVIVYVVWGSTYLAIRVVVQTLPPLLAGGARYLAAGGLMLGVLVARRGRSTLAVSRRQVAGAAVVGFALLFGGNGMVMVAEQHVSSSLAALVIASVPLWVVLLRAATGDRVRRATLGGVALGFAGVALLVLPTDGGGADPLGLALVVVASMSWAGGSFVSTRLSLPADPLVSTGLQMLLGGAVLAVAGVAVGEISDVDVASFSTSSLVALGYLVLIGSVLAFTAYVWLLQNAPISKVATYAYVNPVIAIVLGWWLLSERLTTAMFAGAALIVTSVAFIVRRESSPAREDAVEPAPALAGADRT